MSTPQWPGAEPDGQPPHPQWSHQWAPPEPLDASTGLRPGPHQGTGLSSSPYAPPPVLPPGSAPAEWNPYAAPPGHHPGPPPPGWPPPAGPPADVAPPHSWGFGAFLLAELVFLLTSIVVPVVAVLPYGLGDGAPLPGPVIVAALAVPPIVAALVGLYATRVRGNGPVVDLKLRFGWRDVGIGVACGVGGIVLTLPLGALWTSWVGEEEANSAVGEIFADLRLPVALAIVVFLQVWLIAPLCEEIIFRGLLWGAMEQREWNRWLILAITTVLFSLAHFELQRAPLLLAIALPIGLARMLSGRLAAPVIAHQINNFLPAVALTALLLGYTFE